MSFGVKCATAIIGAVGVLLITAVGFIPNQPQTASAVTGINVVVNVIPAALMALSLLLMVWYRLDEKKMEVISERLHARREGRATYEEQSKLTDIR